MNKVDQRHTEMMGKLDLLRNLSPKPKKLMKPLDRIPVSPNFYLDEFIDPHTYFNTEDHGMSLMDPNMFKIAQLLRDLKGTFLGINNWWHYYIANYEALSTEEIIGNIEESGLYKWSGYRSPRCTIGSSKSAHKSGQAIDPKGDQQRYWDLVVENAAAFYALGLRRLEDISITPGWLHMDSLERFTQPNSIRVVDRTEMTEIIRW